MTALTYTTTDKADWPRGPWDDEPDKAQWVDEATGLDCLIVRGPSGALCGYVGVPPGHPWHGKDYSQCTLPEPCDATYCDHHPDMYVHGGLTFAAACQQTDDPSTGICHVPEPGRPDNVWWFGFDCAHVGDLTPKYEPRYTTGDVYRSWGYVEHEVASLAEQLSAVSS